MAVNALFAPSGIPQAVLTKASADIRAVRRIGRISGTDKGPWYPYMGDDAPGARCLDPQGNPNWAAVAKAANIKVTSPE